MAEDARARRGEEVSLDFSIHLGSMVIESDGPRVKLRIDIRRSLWRADIERPCLALRGLGRKKVRRARSKHDTYKCVPGFARGKRVCCGDERGLWL
jgi:hypothetical protein